MLEFLSEKFNDSESLSYVWKEIEVSQLDEARAANKLKVFETIDGSSKFHCIMFKPNGNSVKASPRICLCDDCSSDYGSCSSFKEYPLICHQLKRVLLRSAFEAVDSLEDEQDDNEISSSDIIKNFIELDSIVAIAASHSSFDTVWFIKVKDTSCFGAKRGDYGNVLAEERPATLQDTFWKKFQKLKQNKQFSSLQKPLTSTKKAFCILVFSLRNQRKA